MNGFCRNILGAAARGAGLLPLLAAPGQAAVIAVETNSQTTQVADNDKHQLQLDDAGDASIVFEQKAVILFTFNAVCSAQGPDGSYVAINISVDGHPTDPKSKQNAFCSPSGSNQQNFTSVTRISTYHFTGHHAHTLRVFATGVGTTSWSIGNSLVSIEE